MDKDCSGKLNSIYHNKSWAETIVANIMGILKRGLQVKCLFGTSKIISYVQTK